MTRNEQKAKEAFCILQLDGCVASQRADSCCFLSPSRPLPPLHPWCRYLANSSKRHTTHTAGSSGYTSSELSAEAQRARARGWTPDHSRDISADANFKGPISWSRHINSHHHQNGYTQKEVWECSGVAREDKVPADGAVGVEVEGHQVFWTCDNQPFILVLTTVPPHTDSLGVSTKTKAGLVTEDDPLPF
ncbi:hypothetical protein NFI96_000842 [Prochilodus magdalenae]|nr:hypothetical protein NFI96_000842 [Prochilodus magdalenae]